MNLRSFFYSILSDGGATYSIFNGELNPKEDYFISLQGFEKVIALSDFNKADLKKYIIENISQLFSEDRYVGAWINEGNVYLDVSIRTSNRSQAIRLGMINNQKAIYNANLGVVIDLPTMQRAGTESQKEAYIQEIAKKL